MGPGRSQALERSSDAVMGILSWILFGLLAGAIAKVVMPGRDGGGLIGTVLLGVGGAFLGGFLYETFLGGSSYMTFSIQSMITAVIGAFVLLGLYRAVF